MEVAAIEAYADLVIKSCINIAEGDRLRISSDLAHRDLVHALAAKAWAAGARAVRVDWQDGRLARLYYDGIRDRYLDEVPSFVGRDAAMIAEEGWSILSIVGEEDPRALDGVDPGKLQRQQRVRSQAQASFRHAVHSNAIPWCVIPAPTAAWGRAVFEAAGRDPGPDPEASLWQALLPILHLDRPDPAASLRAHLEAISARARKLSSLHIAELHFKGPGTDFRVGLSPRSSWAGGGSLTTAGKPFNANHPTEEVFTSPDRRLAEGRVACTRPVKVLGETVVEGWFEFRGGRVVDSGAAKGAETLRRFLDVDPGSRSLGEAALVDATGPIFKSGLVFDNGLIDENAACHIALGSAYFEVFEGAEAMDEAGRAEAGYNESLVHIDFMIGSEEVDVGATLADGSSLDLLKGGRFVV